MVGLIVATYLLVGGGRQLLDRRRVPVTAVVTAVEDCVKIRGGRAPLYRCTVTAEYVADGTRLQATGLTAVRSTTIRVGSTVALWYDPRNPARATTKLTKTWILWAAAVTGIGLKLASVAALAAF